MIASRAFVSLAFVLIVGCGGKILEETAPSGTLDASDPPAAPSQPERFADPFHPGESWIGNYTCAQGNTNLDLEIVAMHDDVVDDALFDFDWKDGGISGSFHLTGVFDPATGNATFTPGAWIDRPNPNGVTWFSVGMTGPATASDFSGSITHESCGTFSLQKS